MEKFDYLAHMFNDRTYRKKYENFVVNAIYSKVGNPELIPVTQQYVKNINDKRRYYLLDLYFPQLNYGVEVDEGQHLTDEHKLSDKQRALNILSAIECEEKRISIFNEDKTMRSAEEINDDINSTVEVIKSKIKEYEQKGKKLKWLSNEEQKKEVLKKNFIDINDDVTFSNFVDVYNFIQGKKVIKGTWKCGRKLNKNYLLWVPQLTIIQENGESNALGGWKNFLSEDHTEVKEVVPDELKRTTAVGPWNENGLKRVIFMKMKDRFGKMCTKFIGVFEAKEIINDKGDKVRVYKRIATQVKISDLRK